MPGPKPTHAPIVLAALEEAEGRPVSLRALSRRVYGDKPPKHHRASVRCMVQRIRQHHGDRLTIECVSVGAYRLVPRSVQ